MAVVHRVVYNMVLGETAMDNDIVEQAINDGLAKGMEEYADSIAHDEQLTRDANEPNGRIVSEEEQEKSASFTAPLRENVKDLRDKASRLKKEK